MRVHTRKGKNYTHAHINTCACTHAKAKITLTHTPSLTHTGTHNTHTHTYLEVTGVAAQQVCVLLLKVCCDNLSVQQALKGVQQLEGDADGGAVIEGLHKHACHELVLMHT